MKSSTQNILLVDPRPESLRVLQDNLILLGYGVDCVANTDDALKLLDEKPYTLVITEYEFPDSDGSQFIGQIELHAKATQPAVIFLSRKNDVDTRLRMLQMGAKDFCGKPMHVKEIIARVRMVTKRLERWKVQDIDVDSLSTGQLEETSVLDLLAYLCEHKKSAILKVKNGLNRDGQIFLSKGLIINAMAGSLRKENAVLEMLTWKRGRYSIIFKHLEVPDEMSMSTVGLLLEGARRLLEVNELEKQLPNDNTLLAVTSNFKEILGKREISDDLKSFIDKFDGTRSISTIISESNYDTLTALERIVKLYRQGFLEIVESEGALQIPQEDEFSDISLKEPSFAVDLEDEPIENLDVLDSNVEQSEEIPVQEEISQEDNGALHHEEKEESGDTQQPREDQESHDLSEAAPESEGEYVIEFKSDRESKIESEEVLTNTTETESEPELEQKLESETVSEPDVEPEEHLESQPQLQQQGSEYEEKGVLIIGSIESGRKKVLETLTAGAYRVKVLKKFGGTTLDRGTTSLEDSTFLEVFGLEADTTLSAFSEIFAIDLAGYIILIDASNSDLFDYYSYLISALRDNISLPFVVAMINSSSDADQLSRYRTNLLLNPDDLLLPCDPDNRDSILNVIRHLVVGGLQESEEHVHIELHNDS